MIDILGEVLGVTLQSKVNEANRIVHTATIKLELTEGVDRMSELTALIKKMAIVKVESRQPSLMS